MNISRLPAALACLLVFFLATTGGACAAPPVRIAVVPGGGSGMEQEVVDGIQDQLRGNGNIALSTVNPDWFVVCNIIDRTDLASATVRVNGTVTIKTSDGQVIDTVSTQSNKQDFSLTPGTPVNKTLVHNAVKEVIRSLVDRSVMPIEKAVDVEIDTRDKVIQAYRLADDDKYEEALGVLARVTPDTAQFRRVRSVMSEFQMEMEALEAVRRAEALAKAGRYSQAITVLKSVDAKSKRFKLAQARISTYQAAMRRSGGTLVKTKSAPSASAKSTVVEEELKALEAQKKALEAQKRALEAEEAALKSKPKATP